MSAYALIHIYIEVHLSEDYSLVSPSLVARASGTFAMKDFQDYEGPLYLDNDIHILPGTENKR